MQMNPNLILQAGQTADVFGALERGNALAQQVNQQRQQNALAGFMRDNGAALMQGDQNALAQFAQYDPMAAFDMMNRQQDQQWQQDERAYQRQRDQRQDSQQDQEWQWKVQEYAAQKSAAERAAEAQQIEDAVKMGLAAPDAATWDAMVTQAGAPDLVGQFDNRQAIGNRYLSVAEILKGQQGQGANFDTTQSLRKEFTALPDVKMFVDQTQAMERIEASKKDPSAAGDLALIFNFMKMLDPGSVVREGEFATAQNATGVPEQIRNQWNRVMTGERLSTAQRDDMLKQAGNIYQASSDRFGSTRDEYLPIAQQWGIDPNLALPSYGWASSSQPAAMPAPQQPQYTPASGASLPQQAPQHPPARPIAGAPAGPVAPILMTGPDGRFIQTRPPQDDAEARLVDLARQQGALSTGSAPGQGSAPQAATPQAQSASRMRFNPATGDFE